ncbi:MAG: hypothetical protein HZB51_08690 [Chloroflexi bacterium]|nr:hypothetical protein [Chloroflexota bacterium]
MAASSNPIDPGPPPLAAIREKERALAQSIQVAHEQTQARIAEAQLRSNETQEQAERDGIQQVEKLYQDGIAHARALAEAIHSDGESAAIRLRENGMARIAEAAEYIMQFVLPHGDKN